MDCSTLDLPVHHQLPELTQTHVHRVGDAIKPTHPLSSPSPPTFNLSQHQVPFQWVSSSHHVAKVLKLQLQHQSFQWIFRTDLLQDGLVGSPCSPGTIRSLLRHHTMYMQSTSCKMSGLMKHKLESRLPGKISITSDMQMIPLMAESKKETKEPLDKGERGEWKGWLKNQLHKTKVMASSPITSWEINGETVETMEGFIFLGSKITADSDWSHEIKRHLLLGRKTMTNLGSILKSRDITLLTKMHIVQAMVFPVVMYGCDSWNIKKTEHRRTDVFKLWCWRSLLRVPWTERRSNQSILKEINPEYSLEGLMLKLKHQYFGHLIWRANSLEKTQMLGKIEVRRKDWREEKKGMIKDETVGWHHQFNGHEFEQTGRWWRTGKPGMLQSMGSQRVGHNLVTEQYTGQFTTLPNRRMGILWKLLCQTF